MDAKQMLLEHFEKIALGIAGLILAAFILTAIVQEQPADTQRNKVLSANAAISRKEEAAKANAPKPEQRSEAREVEVAMKSPALAKDLPSWLFHKRPVIAVKIEGVDIPEAHHFAATIEASEGGLGSIGFRWADDPRDALVKIDKYVIKRAEGKEAKDWKDIETVEAGRTSFTDKNVKPKTNYFYKVVSYASVDTSHVAVQRVKAKGFDVVLAAAEVVLESAVIGPLQTKMDVRLEVVNVTLKTTPDEIKQGKTPTTPSAYLKVWKYFPDKQMWIPQQYTTVRVGAMIGGVEPSGDFKTDYRLIATKRIRVPGKFGEVDADTIEIEDVTTGERIEINNVVLDPELEKIKKNPKPGSEVAEEDAKEGAEKKAGGK